jgi:hypothetical protein
MKLFQPIFAARFARQRGHQRPQLRKHCGVLQLAATKFCLPLANS